MNAKLSTVALLALLSYLKFSSAKETNTQAKPLENDANISLTATLKIAQEIADTSNLSTEEKCAIAANMFKIQELSSIRSNTAKERLIRLLARYHIAKMKKRKAARKLFAIGRGIRRLSTMKLSINHQIEVWNLALKTGESLYNHIVNLEPFEPEDATVEEALKNAAYQQKLEEEANLESNGESDEQSGEQSNEEASVESPEEESNEEKPASTTNKEICFSADYFEGTEDSKLLKEDNNDNALADFSKLPVLDTSSEVLRNSLAVFGQTATSLQMKINKKLEKLQKRLERISSKEEVLLSKFSKIQEKVKIANKDFIILGARLRVAREGAKYAKNIIPNLLDETENQLAEMDFDNLNCPNVKRTLLDRYVDTEANLALLRRFGLHHRRHRHHHRHHYHHHAHHHGHDDDEAELDSKMKSLKKRIADEEDKDVKEKEEESDSDDSTTSDDSTSSDDEEELEKRSKKLEKIRKELNSEEAEKLGKGSEENEEDEIGEESKEEPKEESKVDSKEESKETSENEAEVNEKSEESKEAETLEKSSEVNEKGEESKEAETLEKSSVVNEEVKIK